MQTGLTGLTGLTDQIRETGHMGCNADRSDREDRAYQIRPMKFTLNYFFYFDTSLSFTDLKLVSQSESKRNQKG